jgi:hypothetical protein
MGLAMIARFGAARPEQSGQIRTITAQKTGV